MLVFCAWVVLVVLFLFGCLIYLGYSGNSWCLYY